MKYEKVNIAERYNLPSEVRFCRRCTISNQRPRITFDEDGICSACRYNTFKQTIDWKQREQELIELCDRHRKNDGSYDVIVPCSGGKDGGFVAHQLKYKYKMNPLTVTWAPHIPTEIGRKNFQAFVDSGFDNVTGYANGITHRLMTKLAFIHLGDPFQPFIYGQCNFPLRMAVQHNVQLIMYGENGEVEYGGDMETALQPTRTIKHQDRYYFSGLPPEFWNEHGIAERDLFTYRAPTEDEIDKVGLQIHFMGYYKYWDPQECFYYCVANTGFECNTERSEGTYSKYASLDDKLDGYHYYLMFIKFGIGRATSDTAHEIRDGKISREEGVALIKRYDGEFPKRYFKEFLEYVNMSEEDFWEAAERWRGEHIWIKQGNDWALKKPVWQE